MGIGQKWERFVDRADVVLPMVYPSRFAPRTYKIGHPHAWPCAFVRGPYTIGNPTPRPYAAIDRALTGMKRRSAGSAGAAKVSPWYQDFTLGPPRYGAEQVRAQMQAGYDNGFQRWILWNPC